MQYGAKLIFSLIITSLYANSYGQNVIIVHPACPFIKASSVEIRKIYLGELNKWKGRYEIEPVNQTSDKDIRKVFLYKILNMSNAEYVTYWRNKKQLSNTKPPREFRSSAEVVEFVKNNKNAIGYIEALAPRDSVKILFLNGSEVW
jgi:ABC-type phosphate transport system substrate-binding protein